MAAPASPPPPAPSLPDLIPNNLAESFSTHGIFATLRPYSPLAIANFSSVVDAIVAQPAKYAAVRQRIRLDAHHLLPIADTSSFAGAEESASSDATVPNTPEPTQLAWQGAFVFSYQDPPVHPQLGWIIGYGPKFPQYEGKPKPDVPLTVGPHFQELRLHNTTARLNIDKKSAVCTITPGHNDGTLRRGGMKVPFGTGFLDRPQEIISFGELDYRFEYVPADLSLHSAAVKAYICDALGAADSVNDLIAQTPSPNDRYIGDWRLVQPAGMGTDGEVVAAMRSKGDIVAIKDYWCKEQKDAWNALSKIDNYRSLQARVKSSYVQSLVDVLDEEKIRSAFHPPQHVYVCLQPLVLYDLDKLFKTWDNEPSNKPAEPILHQVLAQILLGIKDLHTAGFIHDDIKPSNIGILRVLPPHVVILDLDNAKDFSWIGALPSACLLTTHGNGGTIGYLAPEREGPQDELFGTGVDVWSAGCVAMEIFLRKPLQDLKRFNINPYRDLATFKHHRPTSGQLQTERTRQEAFVSGLSSSPGTIENLIGQMLAVDPNNRVTVDAALKHPLVAAGVLATQEEETRAKAQPGDKRAREEKDP
ncbi:hypothetical protein M409DRAFT_29520 [Zasmidium cellare ATCC 36951]|uniref:Protein kinase domain-containing protein n=1 Tax=Zasmidium cellare ATCC 36951 TaxID=1080233 RepID=A0A6A6C1D6_ZASCE|nr:uncharacterized protein M409DRAFT_29520 [Zasmidium cellare ATCC 36951]KAF2160078.1 hypothetical protein M409DRAFT_29520 [Zasmidium cellare ATCC 36951]